MTAYGAKADGGLTDNTKAWLAARTAVRANGGGTIVFPPSPKCYGFASPVDFTNLHAVIVKGGGEQGVGGTIEGGVGSRLCFTGDTSATGYPAYDFSGDTYTAFEDLDFGYARGTAPVTLYGQRTKGQGFCEDVLLNHVSIERATSPRPVASLMVNNCEVIEVAHSHIDGIGAGFLATRSATHGIVSPYTTANVGGSMTQIAFLGGKIVGQGTNVQLDATGGIVSDLTFVGTYFSNFGPNPSAFDLSGTIWNLLVDGARYELSSASGTQSFVKAEPGAVIAALNVRGLDCQGNSSRCYALYSSGAAMVREGSIEGVAAPISWVGSLFSLTVANANQIDVVQSGGDILDCTFRAFAGNRPSIAEFIYSGNLFADVGTYRNVVCIQPIFTRGTSRTCNFGRFYGTGSYAATYAHDLCTFLLSDSGPGKWNLTQLNYLNAQSLWSNSGFGRITCPASGNATSITAASSSGSFTGDWFVVQRH